MAGGKINADEKRVEPMDKCLNCGEVFSPGTVIQKFCCEKCGKEYRRTHNMDDLYPSITFNCAKCGRTVVTEGGTKDKRSRFCCAECEKKYWRHPPNENDKHFCNYTEQQLKARENSPD